MVVVNRETGQMVPLKYEERKMIGEKEPQIWDPETRRQSLNETTWQQEKMNLFNLEKQKAEVQDRMMRINMEVAPLIKGQEAGVLTPEEQNRLHSAGMNMDLLNQHIREIDRNLFSGLIDINNKFEKYYDDKTKPLIKNEIRNFKEVTENYAQKIRVRNEEYQKFNDTITSEIDNMSAEEKNKFRAQIPVRQQEVDERIRRRLGQNDVSEDQVLDVISKLSAPEIFVPVDQFAKEKTAQTIGDAAFKAFEKFGDKTPVIAIENVHPDWTIGRADSLREAVEKSRDEFSKKLVTEKHYSKDEANKMAEKIIGATWDVGHINMLRKFGYSEEDIVEETKKIAKFVKHTHLTDNFGFNDTHLPPGMGNVPIKQMMEELEKQGFSGKQIIEAGGFVQHFKTSPHPYTIRYLSSPLYTMKAEPYWSQISEMRGAYSAGFGTMLPEKHFEMYGSGFSNLPQELGGQVSNDRSRFAGTPNE
jgi:hypothetical protein